MSDPLSSSDEIMKEIWELSSDLAMNKYNI